MKSNLVTASVLAIAALAAGASHAEGREPFPEVNAPLLAQGGTSRAAVQADLAQAQRIGYSVNIGRNWNGDAVKGDSGVTTSRAAVRAEAIAALANDNESEGGRL